MTLYCGKTSTVSHGQLVVSAIRNWLLVSQLLGTQDNFQVCRGNLTEKSKSPNTDYRRSATTTAEK